MDNLGLCDNRLFGYGFGMAAILKQFASDWGLVLGSISASVIIITAVCKFSGAICRMAGRVFSPTVRRQQQEIDRLKAELDQVIAEGDQLKQENASLRERAAKEDSSDLTLVAEEIIRVIIRKSNSNRIKETWVINQMTDWNPVEFAAAFEDLLTKKFMRQISSGSEDREDEYELTSKGVRFGKKFRRSMST